MNREILFRGKRVDNGEWVYGGILQNLRKTKWYIGDMFEAVEVVSETIGQYAGIDDSTCEKIYEGDIIQTTDYFGKQVLLPVSFDNGMFFAGNSALKSWINSICTVKVVGNIYDNNDLLKDKEDEK